MSESRGTILSKLRQARTPFKDVTPPEEKRAVVPVEADPVTMRTRFIEEARKLSAEVWEASDEAAALDQVLEILGPEKQVLAWDWEHIPLPGLPDALEKAGVTRAAADDSTVRVGITGTGAALASTGSLILSTDPGRPRSVSLLPYVHVAIVRAEQLLPNLEAWAAAQREAGHPALTKVSNTVIITGASRTADIAMELVLGAHGPAQLHIVLIG